MRAHEDNQSRKRERRPDDEPAVAYASGSESDVRFALRKYVRIFPKEKGTLNCDSKNVTTIQLDQS